MPINLRDKLSFLFNGGRGIGNDQLEGPILKNFEVVGTSLTLTRQEADGTDTTEAFDPQAVAGAVNDYVAGASYDATAHTLTLAIAGNPTLSIANGVYFAAPTNIDKQTDFLTVSISATNYLLYDQDFLRVSANELERGQLYEGRILSVGGDASLVITQPVVSQHGRFDKYLLYMGDAAGQKDDLPTEADFLNTAISAHTTDRFAQFSADIRNLNERGRWWFCCPFDDIEQVLIQAYSTVGNTRADLGTPAIGGQTISFDPYPIVINSRQFYAYGGFLANDNPQFFAQANDFYDMHRY